MIKDNLLIIVDENGELMKAPIGVFKANSNYTSGITVIAPFSLDTIVNVSFKRRNRIEDDAGLYLIPNGKYKGKDLLDKSNSLYQKVAHYNVFENEILGKPLKYIATFRPEELFASVNFGVRQVPALATNFKGKFGINKPLPNDPLEGDFYECDTYNYLLNDVLFTLDDYIYFHNGSWHKANYRAIGGTEPFEVVVKGNIRANEEVESDKDLAILLAGRVATLESETTVLDAKFDTLETSKQDRLVAGENITIEDNVISVVGGSGGGYEPDNITIGLNAEQKLEVKNDLEIDGGFL